MDEFIGPLCQLLAQAGDGGGASNPLLDMLPIILIISGLFWFMLVRPEKQKQAAMKALLDGMKKSDRVVTAGGIKGIVSKVDREADEVTLVVDESSGTKLRFNLSSISRVESDDTANENK